MSQLNQNKETVSLETLDLLDEALVLDSSSYFPIRELSLKTGVNSVTLRAWERRYGLLKPKRTNKGHRLYDQGDVQRVEGILRWIQQGVAVSKVRALLDQGVAFDGVAPSNEWLEWQVSLVKASQAFQEEKIEQLYQQIFSQYPADIAVRDWLLPSFEQLGKGASLAFCESVVLSCLVARTNSLKSQQKHSSNVLIAGLMSQRALWCYMAAAILLDKGISCRVVPNAQQSDDWSALVTGINVESVLVFCENELASKAADLISQMQQWNKPVIAVGAGFWLAAYELNITTQSQVKVYSEALEGVSAFIKFNL
ncbi:MerR family transcriptional regulator [Marinomonas ushuaiensis DSM 15871]|uniref:MerR family transcriptional regulator n=1 Tax=Marinomonas ushuaiensis DSM 15871 TaxID=1122207 RepID=X7E3X3_9GAMM|nr:MerR family transcriptional regulator [Marinomonas ushuaiensis]ETX10657.1 MerR family transcriptional regulator [Marinomonas ushuaiensis DSM 15871]